MGVSGGSGGCKSFKIVSWVTGVHTRRIRARQNHFEATLMSGSGYGVVGLAKSTSPPALPDFGIARRATASNSSLLRQREV